MNSHEFSYEYQISIRTLRYYQDLSLIQPTKVNGLLIFDDQCVKDLKLIKRLQLCSFTIPEICKWMMYKQSIDIPEKEKIYYFKEQIKNKKELAKIYSDHLKTAIKKLEVLINNFSDSYSHFSSGCNLEMIKLLSCPTCGNSFEFKNVHILNNMIFEGNATCPCGYSLKIKEGIIIAQINTNYDTIIPLDYNRETCNRMGSEEISLLHKNFNWITNKIQELDLQDKVIFENSVDVISYLATGIKFMKKGGKYIIADSDFQVISDIKNRIETLGLSISVLYLVCPSMNYPIKNGTIDILIDYYSSEILQRFNIPSLANSLISLLKPSSYIVGVYSYVKKGNKTLKNNKLLYPNSFWGRYQLIPFVDNLKKCGFKILDELTVNSLENCNSIESFQKGDVIGDYCFLAKLG